MRQDDSSAGDRCGVGWALRPQGGQEAAREFAGDGAGERAQRISDRIGRLLAYPKVGPLGADAIVRNLGFIRPEFWLNESPGSRERPGVIRLAGALPTSHLRLTQV